mmetsp:Transcript_21024/g.27176  ORF Transcript_21024/g.27176 Transcript_21024/m.27176 type:complete len:93 (+) Transcript_21024:1495-1773(+)
MSFSRTSATSFELSASGFQSSQPSDSGGATCLLVPGLCQRRQLEEKKGLCALEWEKKGALPREAQSGTRHLDLLRRRQHFSSLNQTKEFRPC